MVTLRQKVFLASESTALEKTPLPRRPNLRTATFWSRRRYSSPRISRRAPKGCCHQASLLSGGVARGNVGVRPLLARRPGVLGGSRRAVAGRVGCRRLAIRACIIRRASSAPTPSRTVLLRSGASGVLRLLLGRATTAHLGSRVQRWERVPGRRRRRQLGARIVGRHVWAGNSARMWIYSRAREERGVRRRRGVVRACFVLERRRGAES